MGELWMPMTDLQYKDELRKQRSDWEDVLEHITRDETEEAKKKAEKVLKRIGETLQD